MGSSVRHMCLPFFCIISIKFFPILRCIFYLVGHRFSTIRLFIRGQILYQRLGSRIVKLIIGRLSDFIFASLFFISVICRNRSSSYYWVFNRSFTLFFFRKNFSFCNSIFIYWSILCCSLFFSPLYCKGNKRY